jgi:opacity protein-like surface antigen
VQDDGIHKGFGWHIYGGYLFDINPLLSIGPEVGYAQPTKNVYKTSFDQVTLPMTIVYSATYLDLLAAARIHATSHLDIIGKFGAASVTQNIEMPLLGTSTGQQVAPELVAGLAYNVSQNVEVNLTYDTILTDGVNQSDFGKCDKIANINTFELGMNYYF